MWLCLTALFSSVALLSLSIMLSHFPNLVEQVQKASGQEKEGA
jgi:hypothetical protein